MAVKTDKLHPDLIGTLLDGKKTAEDIFGENGLLKQLTKALLERMLTTELTSHLGYEKHDKAGNNSGNSRNGSATKTLLGSSGTIDIDVPRDREGNFLPQVIKKNQTRFDGFDEKSYPFL